MLERERTFREFFQKLERAGLAQSKMRETIARSDRRALVDLGLRFSNSLPHAKKKRKDPVGLVANSTLSGGPFPCMAYQCRAQYLDGTARYAALYADQLAIRDPFDDLRFTLSRLTDAKPSDARRHAKRCRDDLLSDLRLLHHVRPLLEAGLMTIADTPEHFCPNCYGLRGGTTSPEVTQRINDVHSKIKNILIKEVPFFIERADRGFYLEVGEHELLGHHATHYHTSQAPAALANTVPVVGQRRRLTKKEAGQSPHVDMLAGRILDDLTAQNMYTATSGAHYLTDRLIDMEMIRHDEGATGSGPVQNQALMDGMAHSLPFLSSVPLETLVELREKEGEAFEVYRHALEKALEQSKAKTADEVREAVDDLIRPEVAKIELLVRNTKSVGRRNLAVNAGVATGFITAALWSGMLPASIAAVVGAIGGFSGIKAMVGDLPALFQDPGEVRKEQFYFLWRVKKADTQRSR